MGLHISTADAQSLAQCLEALPGRARRIPRRECPTPRHKDKVRYSTDGSVAIVPNVSNKNKEFHPFLTLPLAQPRSVVPSVVNRTAQHFLNGERAGLLKLSATRLTPLTNTKGRCGRRHVRSDSRPPFSLWTEIEVRTTTDTRRLSHAQPKVILARNSLKSTGQHPRRPTSFTDFSFAIHLYRPGFGPETSFFTHQLEFVRHLQARRRASGSAR